MLVFATEALRTQSNEKHPAANERQYTQIV